MYSSDPYEYKITIAILRHSDLSMRSLPYLLLRVLFYLETTTRGFLIYTHLIVNICLDVTEQRLKSKADNNFLNLCSSKYRNAKSVTVKLRTGSASCFVLKLFPS
jgi:hypothetical protein